MTVSTLSAPPGNGTLLPGKSSGAANTGFASARDGGHSLHDIDFVEQVGEPRCLDPENRRALVQEKMDTWRQIFLDGLMRQICLVRDPGFRYPRNTLVERDGTMRRELVYVAPEPWCFEENSTVFLRLNFGERNWSVTGKSPVIRVGAKDNLLPTLEKLHVLTGFGELDEIIGKMVIVSTR